MITSYFQRLYKYNEWANQQVFQELESIPELTPEITVQLSHYLAAQEIWISRITGRALEVGGVWEVYSLERCKELADSTAGYWNAFLADIKSEDYTRLIAYKNTKGDYYETPVLDIMAHCVNHATYHRAQIAKLLRQAGGTPLNSDYITYARAFALEL